MFEIDLFGYVLELLTEEMADTTPPPPEPIQTDSWVARSIMQKAIRRGMTDLALRAAATLIATDRRVIWNRLIVTAMEDLGVGEVDLLARIIAAYRDRAWRARVGGEWAVIAHLITTACAGTRCESANDLWNVAKNDPVLDGFKTGLCDGTMDDLLAIIVDEDRDIAERGAAVLIASGEDAGPSAPTRVSPDPAAVFAAFSRSGWFGHVVVTYQEAYRLTRLALSPLSLCLWRASTSTDCSGTNDDVPPTTWIGDIPAFALDQYTRGGKAAIRRFVKESTEWKAFTTAWNIPSPAQLAAAGELLFRAEGARVTNRRQWPAGQGLYVRSEPLGCYVPAQAVQEGLSLMRRQLPLMDRLRSAYIPISS